MATKEVIMTSHWGEITASKISSTSSKSTAILSVESPGMKPKSLVIDPARPHQPTAYQKVKNLPPVPAELCRPDQLSLNTIQLLKQNTRIRCAMVQFPNDPSKYDDKSNVPLLSTPPPPSADRRYSPELDVNGVGSIPRIPLTGGTVEIESSTARQLGRRAVGTVCAHSGFELIQESSLETLTDVLHEYMTKVCRLLRAAVDREALTGSTGFQDVLAHVFQDIGIGSTDTLHKFWKTRVKDYNAVIQRRNAQLRERMQTKRTLSTSSMGEESKSPRLKEESFSDIHFPETDQEHETMAAESSDSQSQPLTFNSLNELEEAARAASNIPDGGDSEGQWTYIKSEPINTGHNDESRNVGESTVGEQNDDESAGSFVSESPNIVDIDVTSPAKNTSIQELASPPVPKKKRKKSGSVGTPS